MENIAMQSFDTKDKKYKFKRGDVIAAQNGKTIAIFEKIDYVPLNNDPVVFYSTRYTNNEFLSINEIDYGIGKEKDIRLATDKERDTLIYALKEEVNKGNKEANEVLKEVFGISPIIRTYQDLIDNQVGIEGAFFTGKELICYRGQVDNYTMDVASSEKVAKSMLAMAMISQLMPYYGGEITDEEWGMKIAKYSFVAAIDRNTKKFTIFPITRFDVVSLLSFHTEKQRDDFLKYNAQLVKDYLMIE